MGHNKYLFLIPGKPPPFLMPELFISLGLATTLAYTHLREPLCSHLSNFPAGAPRPPRSTRGAAHLPAAGRCRS